MPLKPRDKSHEAQIQAGITGRLKGHDFEKFLASRINAFKGKIKPLPNSNQHLFCGSPELILLNFVLTNLNRGIPKQIRAYAVGGHATGERGDDLQLHDGTFLRRAKSDIILELQYNDSKIHAGISVKTCSKKTPTNDQLFCSTADAFCNLLQTNSIEVPTEARNALKQFCGDVGFRPLDSPQKLKRLNSERWFWEELPKNTQDIWRDILNKNQVSITKLLLCKGYAADPFPPEFVFHQTVVFDSWDNTEIAVFSVDQLIALSCKKSGFTTSMYTVKKGRFKDPTTTHEAPRFGFVQFQRLGNKQNATQLQFNLQAGYFYKLPAD